MKSGITMLLLISCAMASQKKFDMATYTYYGDLGSKATKVYYKITNRQISLDNHKILNFQTLTIQDNSKEGKILKPAFQSESTEMSGKYDCDEHSLTIDAYVKYDGNDSVLNMGMIMGSTESSFKFLALPSFNPAFIRECDNYKVK